MQQRDISHFMMLIDDLIQDTRIWKMRQYIQHGSVNCLEHSFLVAFYSYAFCKKFHISCDERALVRGALLHDYFLYDWHDKEGWHRFHGFRHPRFACRNAIRDFQISGLEQEIISKHMWPLTIIPPTTREAWIVNGVDTFSGLVEFLIQFRLFHAWRRKWLLDTIALLKSKEA